MYYAFITRVSDVFEHAIRKRIHIYIYIVYDVTRTMIDDPRRV